MTVWSSSIILSWSVHPAGPTESARRRRRSKSRDVVASSISFLYYGGFCGMSVFEVCVLLFVFVSCFVLGGGIYLFGFTFKSFDHNDMCLNLRFMLLSYPRIEKVLFFFMCQFRYTKPKKTPSVSVLLQQQNQK